MSITEDTLAAYADGELEGAEAARVAEAVAAVPALAAKVEAHRALKARLAAHYAPIAEQTVPAHFAALLSGGQDKNEAGGGEIISFAAERQKRGLVPMLRRWGPIAGPALAASLVLAVLQPWNGVSPLAMPNRRWPPRSTASWLPPSLPTRRPAFYSALNAMVGGCAGRGGAAPKAGSPAVTTSAGRSNSNSRWARVPGLSSGRLEARPIC